MSIFVCLQVFLNSYCSTFFRFACELRLASHAKRLLISVCGKVILIKESFTNKPSAKKKQDQKSLALISFNV